MIIPIVGPSCAGKSLLLHNLRSARPEIQVLESVTTRPRRPSDTTPGEYLFVDEREFDRLDAAGEFLWVVHPHGLPYRYGTRKMMIAAGLGRGIYAPILVPEAIKKLYDFAHGSGLPEGVRPIYLHIEDEDELRRRFRQRGDNDTSEIERRVLNARYENMQAQNLGGIHQIDATRTPEQILKEALAYIRFLEQ
jgi:guanylate kinase